MVSEVQAVAAILISMVASGGISLMVIRSTRSVPVKPVSKSTS